MRIRTTVGAALGALALVLTLPTSAGAADGSFTYVHNDRSGAALTYELDDPQSEKCINLPETMDAAAGAAHMPTNDTESTAVVFSEANCKGQHFTLQPEGGQAPEQQEIRSVVFS